MSGTADSTPGRIGRRQRRIARRRERIKVAAAKLFAEKGYAATTTRQIAEMADVAEGTLYNYFEGKREILLTIASETALPVMEAIQDAGLPTDQEGLVSLFERALSISEDRLPFTRVLINESWVDEAILRDHVGVRLKQTHRLLQAFIEHGIHSGTFRPIDSDLGARMVMGMFAGLILLAVRGLEPLPTADERRELAEMVIGILLDGVRLRAD